MPRSTVAFPEGTTQVDLWVLFPSLRPSVLLHKTHHRGCSDACGPQQCYSLAPRSPTIENKEQAPPAHLCLAMECFSEV